MEVQERRQLWQDTARQKCPPCKAPESGGKSVQCSEAGGLCPAAASKREYTTRGTGARQFAKIALRGL